ncbi:MAG TPA: aminoglycoside phosphotransferase family protein [bacterium]|nr:aminoglycoside phosphotransferase family protein [bacterium]
MNSLSAVTDSFVDIPDGLDIPGLSILLDAGAMRKRLEQTLPAGPTRITACHITNFRFRTPTNCTIAYELTAHVEGAPSDVTVHAYARAYSQAAYPQARHKALSSRWVVSAIGTSVQMLDELYAVLYWYPNDERLSGLRGIAAPRKLQRLFYQNLSDFPSASWRISDRSIRLSLLRYKPERRAVLRCRFRAHRLGTAEQHELFVFLGVYEDVRAAQLSGLIARLTERLNNATELSLPRTIACVPDAGLLVSEVAPGDTLQLLLSENTAFAAEAINRSANAIARLHRVAAGSDIPANPGHEARLFETVELIGRLAPDCLRTAREIADQLGRDGLISGANRSVIHGDLHPGQILLSDARTTLVDLDRTRYGDPLEDIGNFCAQLRLGPPGGPLWDPDTVQSRFLSAYERSTSRRIDQHALSRWIAFALLRAGVIPLGRFQPNWRAAMKDILAAAQERLQ